MQKLLISSKLFVSLMSTINFSSLTLGNSIQFEDASSVIIGLEFVLLNLCLTNSENLLSLSFQKNPDLLIFWAAARIFSDVWVSESNWSTTGRPVLTWPTDDDWLVDTPSSGEWQRVYGSLVLLAPRWTVVKRSLCRWCSHRTQGHASSALRCAGWAHNLWEGHTRQGSQGPH